MEPRRRAAGFCLIAVATAGVLGSAFTRTLPAHAPPPETITQVSRPFDEMLHAQKLSSTVTLLGEPEQPLAFAIVAPDADVLVARLVGAGWMAADRPAPANLLRLAREGLGYATAPLAPAFWNNQMNDLAFERPIQRAQSMVIATVRVWRTSYRMGQDRVFVGVAREYDGIRWGVLHRISPDVDAASDAFVQSLKLSGKPFDICQRPLVTPMIGTYLMGGRFFTRGNMWLLNFGEPTDAAQQCGALGPGQ